MNVFDKALSLAKVGVMLSKSGFVSTVAMQLMHTADTTIPTACTNGTCIKYNPEFFISLEKKERVSLILHETWHVALMHCVRYMKLNQETMNLAADYVVNQLLLDAGEYVRPDWYQDNRFRGMGLLEVYKILISENKTMPESEWDIVLSSGTSKEDTAKLKLDIESILIQAKTVMDLSGKDVGKLPKDLEHIFNRITKPKVNWEEVVASFINDLSADDYSWSKPNKYFMPDFFLPGIHSMTLGHLTFAIDTSGSMSKATLDKILSEIKYIFEIYKPKKMTLLGCDYTLNNIHIVTPDTEIEDLVFTGGGGTSCYPVFEYCNNNPTEALIYFTDLYLEPYVDEVDYPVLWVVYDNSTPKVNIGQIVEIELDDAT